MVFHSFGPDGLLRNAGSAVDLFFILSGFVIRALITVSSKPIDPL
jgi:peptidoglycan/LPS O-acetylase OafA/YrhL